jgi:hypothetical protein
MTYYKILRNNQACNNGNFDYTAYLPHDGQPGEWTPIIEDIEPCKRGWHVTDARHLLDWCKGNQLFEVETAGNIIEGNDKAVCESIRLIRQIEGWNDKNLRLFACWCAEQVLPIFEKDDPDDKQPRQAIETARRYANGEATAEELAAAWAAASAVAWAAASAAAWAVAWAVAWYAARAAAWYAAWAVAWYAARDTASASARDVARDVQNAKLIEMIGLVTR